MWEPYWNDFMDNAQYFFQGVDHLCFYCVLQQNNSYRKVKWKARSLKPFRDLTPTYPYTLGKIKFPKVRTGFFWYYYTPPIDFDEYPETGWLSELICRH